MPKKASYSPVTNTPNNASGINDALDAINTKLENTVSRDGSTPNSMSADLDMNSNDILNIGSLGVAGGAVVDLASVASNSHTHSNKTLLDNTTASYTAADQSKLSGIEAGATGDQSNAEIKTAYESNSDTNAFTDSEKTKLSGIETAADVTDTTNVTAAGALMDSELADLAAVKALDQGVATTDSPTFVTLDVTNLDIGSSTVISSVKDEDSMVSNSATALATQQSIKAYVDSAVSASLTYVGGYDADTNTPDLDSSPSGISLGDTYAVTVAGNFFATAVNVGDLLIAEQNNPTLIGHWTVVAQSLDAASIKTLYESNSDTNAFTDALSTKLSGIEALADVTDTANVTAAGALMDSELASIASVKALNQGLATTDTPEFDGLTIGTSTSEAEVDIVLSNNTAYLGTNSGTSAYTPIATDSIQVKNSGTSSAPVGIFFEGQEVSGQTGERTARIEVLGTASVANKSQMAFKTRQSSGSLIEAMRINGDGYLGVNNNAPSYPLDVTGVINTDSELRSKGWICHQTRAAFVTWVASNTPASGELHFDGTVFYKGNVGSTAITDLPDFDPIAPYHFDHWGIVRETNTGQSSSSENNSTLIQKAVDWVGDNGGGVLYTGGGVIAFDDTIHWGDKADPVILQGNGRGVPSSGKSSTRKTPGTRFLWGGTAGDRGLVLTADRTDASPANGLRSGGSGILDCFIDGAEVGTAATAVGGPMLSIISMNDMRVRVLIGYAPGGCLEVNTLVNGLGTGAGDTQRGFLDIETTDVNTSNEPYWHCLFTGKSANSENTSLIPSIKLKLAPESTAVAAHFEFMDGSRIEYLHASTRTAASGDGGKVYLHGSDTLNGYHSGAYSNQGHCRRVTFDYVQATEGLFALAGTTESGPNIIKHYSRGNGAPAPTISSGAVLHYWDENVGLQSAFVFPPYAASVIADKASDLNTSGKVAGKAVWDTTNNRVMVAQGSATTGAWHVADGSTSVTPA